ncbi:MAG TPA: EamA family transporter [Steroidobacteraceae bacterium]|nr:EamA family transporter [Steroidobacteraceae bacterium]
MSLRIWTTFIVLCIIWGIPYFLIKVALVDLSPSVVAWGRIALGALVLLPIAWHRGVLRPALAHKGALIAFAVCELVIPFSMISFAETRISSSLTGVLIATVPLTVAVIAPLFGIREKIGPRRSIGLMIGFAGVVALLGIDRLSGTEQWIGAASLVFAVLGYAIGPLIVQRHLAGVDELGATAASLSVACLVLLPFAMYFAPTHTPSLTAIGSVIVLGVVCTALALILFFYLIHAAGASRAAVVAYINPGIAALLGVVVLHEPFGLGLVIGLSMILFGSWLATSGKKEEAVPQAASA